MRLSLSLLLLLTACAVPELPPAPDFDGDGHDGKTDCAPMDPDIHPGADEICDGLDNDCDDDIDEEPVDGTPFFPDDDDDGFGDMQAAPVLACTAPEGHADNADDCDDGDDQVGGPITWYVDSDDDGHGAPGTGTVACDRPAGHVDNADDCDDSDPKEFPGQTWYYDADQDGFALDDATATVQCEIPGPAHWTPETGDCNDAALEEAPDNDEVCMDGWDNDCDGPADCRYDPQFRLSHNGRSPDVYLQSAKTSDEAGWRLAQGDVDRDGLDDLLIATATGVAIVTGGSVGPGTSSLGTAATWWLHGDGQASSTFGQSIAVVGDYDNDGWNEILVGDPRATRALSGEHGAVFLLFSNAPDSQTPPAYDDSLRLYGPSEDSRAGARVTYATGLLRGQGFAVSAPGAQGGDGSVFLVEQIEEDLVSDTFDATALSGTEITGVTDSNMLLGAGLAMLDTDEPTLAIGAARRPSLSGVATSPSDAGALFLFRKSTLDATDAPGLADADVIVTGEVGSASHFGAQVANAGDVDRDGLDDLLVAAPDFDSDSADRVGKVYLLSGAIPKGTRATVDQLGPHVIATFLGPAADAALGTSLAGAGDVDADGYDDILLGAPAHAVSGSAASGVAALFFGGPDLSGAYDLSGTTSSPSTRFYSTVGSDELGAGVALHGDFDGDGFDDVAIGIPGDDVAAADGGSVALILGKGP